MIENISRQYILYVKYERNVRLASILHLLVGGGDDPTPGGVTVLLGDDPRFLLGADHPHHDHPTCGTAPAAAAGARGTAA